MLSWCVISEALLVVVALCMATCALSYGIEVALEF